MKRSIAAAIMLFCVALAIAVLVPAAQPVQVGNATNADSKGTDLGKAGDYCVKKGGEVDVVYLIFNTNAGEQDSVSVFPAIANFASSRRKKMDREFT